MSVSRYKIPIPDASQAKYEGKSHLQMLMIDSSFSIIPSPEGRKLILPSHIMIDLKHHVFDGNLTSEVADFSKVTDIDLHGACNSEYVGHILSSTT